uniref:Putative secreted protein n=1 Tax=Ixodes ricinus TaxID=34613 RepID=A0A6B0UIX9_IXORI
MTSTLAQFITLPLLIAQQATARLVRKRSHRCRWHFSSEEPHRRAYATAGLQPQNDGSSTAFGHSSQRVEYSFISCTSLTPTRVKGLHFKACTLKCKPFTLVGVKTCLPY